MTAQAIRDLLHKTPFTPFTLHLADGRSMPVPHPDFAHVSPRGRLLVMHTQDERLQIVDTMLVVSLSEGLQGDTASAA
jgi:hypothetical protein